MRRVVLACLALASLGAADAGGDARDRLRRIAPSWYDPARDDWKRVDLDEPSKPDASRIHGGSIGVEAIALLLTAAIVGALAALAVQLWRSRRLALDDAAAPKADVGRAVAITQLPVAAPDGLDPEAALARALAAGDWRAATVWLYALMLLALDAAGVVRLARGKTNGAYRREAAGSPARGDLGAGIEAFERAYFGHQTVDEPAVRALEAALARLRAAAARAADGASA